MCRPGRGLVAAEEAATAVVAAGLVATAADQAVRAARVVAAPAAEKARSVHPRSRSSRCRWRRSSSRILRRHRHRSRPKRTWTLVPRCPLGVGSRWSTGIQAAPWEARATAAAVRSVRLAARSAAVMAATAAEAREVKAVAVMAAVREAAAMAAGMVDTAAAVRRAPNRPQRGGCGRRRCRCQCKTR